MKVKKISILMVVIFAMLVFCGCVNSEQKEHQVTIMTGGFATVYVSKSTAKQGEIITLSYEPSSSIRFKSWWVFCKHTGEDVNVTNNHFVMPDDDVWVYCDVEWLGW